MDWIMTTAMSAVADAWSSHAGLGGDVDRLRAMLPRAQVLIDRAEPWQFTSTCIVNLLVQLKDADYDAEDLINSLTTQKRFDGEKPFSSFCAFFCDFMAGAALKVKEANARIDLVSAELERAMRELDMDGKPAQVCAFRQTSSFLGGSLVLGRDRERDEVVQKLLNIVNTSRPDCSSRKRQKKYHCVAVLPLVGIGGVGKTALAQVVYNDQRVQGYFNLRMWVCLPETLGIDLAQVMREIIESATKEASMKSGLTNLDALQGIVMDIVVSRKFLLVLDNAWSENVEEWQRLCAPLKYGLPGSAILVTTRSHKVGYAVGTMNPICLSGLTDEVCWDLFKQCTLGEQGIADHPELEDIGKKIVSRLNGSPLATKTVCSMLNSNMSAKHWRSIMKSELWELEEHGESGIIPVLRLSYQHLPARLKRCFTFCGIFPKGYPFRKESLTDMWIAEGFIDTQYGIGDQCWQELCNRCFFQQDVIDKNCSVPDLMCDLARSVSVDECRWLESNNWHKLPHTVRHLSVYTKYLEPSKLMEIDSFTKLRSLVIFGSPEKDFSSSLHNLFEKLANIRLLVLRKCNIKQLPKNTSNLKQLRYLDISSTNIHRLPESVFQISNLQILNMNSLKGMSRLNNLRKCYIDKPITSVIGDVSNLTSLQNSVLFEVPKEQGHRIAELKDMTQLSELLHIRNLENVVKQDHATQAMLHKKEHLRELIVEWSSSLFGNAIFDGTKHLEEKMVLESLEPHSNLEHLKLKSYGGAKSPSWLETGKLNCLRELWFSKCHYLTSVASLPSPLELLHIEDCRNLSSLEDCLQAHNLKRIKRLHISNCENLASLPVERFHRLSALKSLAVQNCPSLPCTRKLSLPPSTETLLLDSCGYLDESLPDCLYKLPSLMCLALYNCHNVMCLPDQVVRHLKALQLILVYNCNGLQSFGGLNYLPILINLQIANCPSLTDLGASMGSNNSECQGMQKLEDLAISHTSLLKQITRNTLPRLQTLMICQSSDSLIQGAHKWAHCFPSLEELMIHDCRYLEELPKELHSLSSLQLMRICNCPLIQSLPENGLPGSLDRLTFENCNPMLVEQLKKLDISYNTGPQF